MDFIWTLLQALFYLVLLAVVITVCYVISRGFDERLPQDYQRRTRNQPDYEYDNTNEVHVRIYLEEREK